MRCDHPVSLELLTFSRQYNTPESHNAFIYTIVRNRSVLGASHASLRSLTSSSHTRIIIIRVMYAGISNILLHLYFRRPSCLAHCCPFTSKDDRVREDAAICDQTAKYLTRILESLLHRVSLGAPTRIIRDVKVRFHYVSCSHISAKK